jgi:hypothetical protein
MILAKNPHPTIAVRILHSQPRRRSSAFLQKNYSRKSFPCHSYKLFYSPYPITPLFAALTQTPGVTSFKPKILLSFPLPTTGHSGTVFCALLHFICTKTEKPLFSFQSLAHNSAIKGEGGVGAPRRVACPFSFSPPVPPALGQAAASLATRHSSLATSADTEGAQFYVLPGFNDGGKGGPS